MCLNRRTTASDLYETPGNLITYQDPITYAYAINHEGESLLL